MIGGRVEAELGVWEKKWLRRLNELKVRMTGFLHTV